MPTRSSPAMLSWACWTRLWESHGGFHIFHTCQLDFTSFLYAICCDFLVLIWRCSDVPIPSGCTISAPEVVDIKKDMKADLVHHGLSFKRLQQNMFLVLPKIGLPQHYLISKIVIQKRHWRSRRRMPSWRTRRVPRHV